MVKGDEVVPVVPTSAGRIATAICFDADFPEFIRQAGESRADLLIVAAIAGERWRVLRSVPYESEAELIDTVRRYIARPAAGEG